MNKREGPLWKAMEAALDVIDRNREGMRQDAAWNADVTPVVDLARNIVEQCAAIADKEAARSFDLVDTDGDYADGLRHSAHNIAAAIRELIK